MSTITELPLEQRPREKLLRYGAQSLSDSELLAIFLRVGIQGQNAIELATSLLNAFGGLPQLLSANEEDFCTQRGLGRAKFAQLQAVLEMARRHYVAQLKNGVALSHTQATVHLLSERLAHEQREVMCALYLNSKHHLLDMEIISHGSLCEAPIYPRELVRLALKHNAGALILAHNHPSGDPTPSQADIDVSRQLKDILRPLDIRLLDHVIIGHGLKYTSLAELGYL
jgi:DNA repair protein RadC